MANLVTWFLFAHPSSGLEMLGSNLRIFSSGGFGEDDASVLDVLI